MPEEIAAKGEKKMGEERIKLLITMEPERHI